MQELVRGLESWLPPEVARLAIAAAVIVVGYLVATLFRMVLTRLFRRMSSRLLSLTGQAARGAHVEESKRAEAAAVVVAGRIVFWLVFALFLGAAMSLLGFAILSAWLESLAAYLPRVLAAAAIVLLGVLSGLLVRGAVSAGVGARRPGYARSFGRAAQLSVVALSLAVAIEQLGIEVTFLIVIAAIVLGAVLGAAALAFGLGARVTVGNLLASHYLSRWYAAGQRVRIGEHEGRILELLPSAVIVQTEQGKVYVPSSRFAESASILLEESGAP